MRGAALGCLCGGGRGVAACRRHDKGVVCERRTGVGRGCGVPDPRWKGQSPLYATTIDSPFGANTDRDGRRLWQSTMAAAC